LDPNKELGEGVLNSNWGKEGIFKGRLLNSLKGSKFPIKEGFGVSG